MDDQQKPAIVTSFFYFPFGSLVDALILVSEEVCVCLLFYACLLPQHDFSSECECEGSVRSTLKLAALGTRPVEKKGRDIESDPCF